MGRRIFATATVSGRPNGSSNDEVLMLAKTESKEVPAMDDSAEKHAEVKLPRSVLKRKLPLMTAAASERSSTGD